MSDFLCIKNLILIIFSEHSIEIFSWILYYKQHFIYTGVLSFCTKFDVLEGDFSAINAYLKKKLSIKWQNIIPTLRLVLENLMDEKKILRENDIVGLELWLLLWKWILI